MQSAPKGTLQRYKSLRNFRYVLRTRYAWRLDMLLRNKERNLYHIAFGSAEYIEFSERKYIELAEANISLKNKNTH